jgi:hypothetical protein
MCGDVSSYALIYCSSSMHAYVHQSLMIHQKWRAPPGNLQAPIAFVQCAVCTCYCCTPFSMWPRNTTILVSMYAS